VNPSRWQSDGERAARGLCRVIGAAALCEALVVPRMAAQVVTPVPFARGEVTFLMHSTIVGAFTGRAPIAQAEFAGNQLSEVRGWVEVRVSDMRTGIAARDRHMRDAMTADSYPIIRFDLVEAQPLSSAGDTVAVTFDGRLTLDGVTRPVRVQGRVVTRPGGTDVEATFPIDMRDYGIVPPVRALVLRVSPQVLVTARLSFGDRSGP
jgi:polyisoprenoid-binding protein YceI